MNMSNTLHKGRRDFLKKLSLSGGGLMLGFSWFDSNAAAMPFIMTNPEIDIAGFNSYLSIAADGVVTIASPNPELGQNIKTSFAMIVAEELDADWNKVNVVQAPLDPKRFERQVTGGSGAIPHSWKRLRTAGATARTLLISAAAAKWNVPADQCTAENGSVIHKASGKKAGYGELASAASKLAVPADVKLKDPKDFKIIGKPIKNVENKNIVTGKGMFGIDFYREGMMYATVQRPPAFGTKLVSYDGAAAKGMPGITDVVSFGNNVAVVGRSTWEVLKAKKTLKIKYEKEGEGLESSSDHDRFFSTLMNSSDAKPRRKEGDVDAAFRDAAKIVKAEYECPFVPHNTLEPMNFFAHVREDGIELVGPTQTPGSARKAVSDLLKVPEEKITVDITRLGGGFGRRLKTDFAVEAAELSSLIKKPVQVIWTREDDMGGGSYRPAARYRFEAALDTAGNITGYKCRGVGMNMENSLRQDNFPAGAIDNILLDTVEHKSPITVGAWRAPTTNFLAFAEQSFLDEVAIAAKKDPVQLRLELLQKAKTKPAGPVRYDIARMEGVIKEVAEKAGWGKKKGVSQGFSVYFSHASYVAQVCDVVMKNGKPEVQKIYAVSDCGMVINETGASQQVMGAIVDGYGTAMYGKLSFKDGEPEQKNFDRYQLIRMKEIPEIEASFVKNTIDPTGLGEPALPPTGGAVANAIFKATGKRIRKQPFIDEASFLKS
jgi:isoquinoline 1-oxidoreductase beta subunit